MRGAGPPAPLPPDHLAFSPRSGACCNAAAGAVSCTVRATRPVPGSAADDRSRRVRHHRTQWVASRGIRHEGLLVERHTNQAEGVWNRQRRHGLTTATGHELDGILADVGRAVGHPERCKRERQRAMLGHTRAKTRHKDRQIRRQIEQPRLQGCADARGVEGTSRVGEATTASRPNVV